MNSAGHLKMKSEGVQSDELQRLVLKIGHQDDSPSYGCQDDIPYLCMLIKWCLIFSGANALQWHHNGLDVISNHWCLHCLFNPLFSSRSKKTSKDCITGLCKGNSPVTSEFPSQWASYAENVSIWWRHHGVTFLPLLFSCRPSVW